MNDEDPAMPDGSGAAAQPIEGREAFQRALLDALAECAAREAPQLWLCDRDFADWPLGRPATIEALTRCVGSKRRLHLLAADYTAFSAQHPRWVTWRRQWAHAVQCLAAHEEVAIQVPSMLLVPGVVAVRLHDRARQRGRIYRDATDLARCHDLVDVLLQRTEESFPVTTLGL